MLQINVNITNKVHFIEDIELYCDSNASCEEKLTINFYRNTVIYKGFKLTQF